MTYGYGYRKLPDQRGSLFELHVGKVLERLLAQDFRVAGDDPDRHVTFLVGLFVGKDPAARAQLELQLLFVQEASSTLYGIGRVLLVHRDGTEVRRERAIELLDVLLTRDQRRSTRPVKVPERDVVQYAYRAAERDDPSGPDGQTAAA